MPKLESPYLSFENLERFEEKIFHRGEQIAEEGKVEMTYADELKGEFHFNVFGTRKYAVRLDLQGARLKKMHCSCPYFPMGNCKHCAASLVALASQFETKQGPLNVDAFKNKVLPTLARAYADNPKRYFQAAFENIASLQKQGAEAFPLVEEALKQGRFRVPYEGKELLDGFEKLSLSSFKEEFVSLCLAYLQSAGVLLNLSSRGYPLENPLREALSRPEGLSTLTFFAGKAFFSSFSPSIRKVFAEAPSFPRYAEGLLLSCLEKGETERFEAIDPLPLDLTAELSFALGKALLEKGKKKQAQRYFQKALQTKTVPFEIFSLALEAGLPSSFLLEEAKTRGKEKAFLLLTKQIPFSKNDINGLKVEELAELCPFEEEEDAEFASALRLKANNALWKKSLSEDEYQAVLTLVERCPCLEDLSASPLLEQLSLRSIPSRKAYCRFVARKEGDYKRYC